MATASGYAPLAMAIGSVGCAALILGLASRLEPRKTGNCAVN
ncbi:MAG: hypothetical protein ACJ8FH_04220 [Sphingomicrobium sp.]